MTISSQVLDDKEVFTVHQLNQTARNLLEDALGPVWVKGELSSVKLYPSGHLYFTLKDEQAIINCVMFNGKNRLLKFTPESGMEVLIRAEVTIYEAQGKYQLNVSTMEPWGLGQLQQAFEALKAKLQGEGLFDTAHKKQLPKFPRHIGIITSPKAAALQDILSVLKRRYPIAPITIYPTAVQGKGAAQEIARAIARANQKAEVDVIILTRGGGSLEDLWCFNEEVVARAIFASEIPLISGVGHEVDFTISDFVADLRAPTPSVAAETITPDSPELMKIFEQKYLLLLRAIKHHIQQASQKIDLLEKQLIHPGQHLKQLELRCIHLHERLNLLIKTSLERFKHRISLASGALHSVSPLATLSRGYAIVTAIESNHIIREAGSLQIGEEVRTQVAKGEFVSVVKEII